MKHEKRRALGYIPALVFSLLISPSLAAADEFSPEQGGTYEIPSINEIRAAATGRWHQREDIDLLRARLETMHRINEMQRQELDRAAQQVEAMSREVAELRAAQQDWAEEREALLQRVAVQVGAPIPRRRVTLDPPEIQMMEPEPAADPDPAIYPVAVEEPDSARQPVVAAEPELPADEEVAVVADEPPGMATREPVDRDTEELPADEEVAVVADEPPGMATREPVDRDTEERPADPIGDGVEAMALRGEALMQEGDLAGAEQMFIAVIEVEPDHLGARVGLATVYYLRGEFTRSLRAFNSLAREAPDHEEVLGMQGLIAWRQGRLQDATVILRQALDHHPLSARLHNYMGVVWHAQGEYDRAEHEFLRAVELDNELEEAFFNLAVLLCLPQKASIDEARLFYERAIYLGRERHPQIERILYGN